MINNNYRLIIQKNNRNSGKPHFFGIFIFAVFFIFAVSSAQAANYTVTTTADGAAGSLREAINSSNGTTTDDSINFAISASDAGCAAGVCTLTLTGGEILIDKAGSLTINGTGARNLIISGNNASRVFHINFAGITVPAVTLNDITVTKGKFNGDGGGIYNRAGTLTVTNSIISGNASQGYRGGGINSDHGTLIVKNSSIKDNTAYSGSGGGIYIASGAATIENSSLSGNLVGSGDGSGIYNYGGSMTLTNSTIDGGFANTGGGIFNYLGALNLANCTISNVSSSYGGGIYNFYGTAMLTNSTISNNSSGYGGGVYNYNSATSEIYLRNTIVAGNNATYQPDVYRGASGVFTSNGNNLIGNAVDTGTPVVWNTAAGTADILNQSPRLAPLGNYGGATLTHALLSGSPAINAGNNCVLTANGCGGNNTALLADQRGAARIGNVDIGAFEINNSANGGTFKAVLPNGRQTATYNTILTNYDDAKFPNFTFSVTGGALPNGVTLTGTASAIAANQTVALSGTPTQSGVFNFTVTGTDGTSSVATDYSINILAPTAASAVISGRVLNYKGRGICSARVTLTGSDGSTQTTTTNSFGVYRLTNVATAGQTVVVSVRAKNYYFGAPSQVVSLTGDVGGLDFIALP